MNDQALSSQAAPPSQSSVNDLLVAVSRRLFTILLICLTAALVISLLLPYLKQALNWEHGDRIIVPGIVIISGVIGGFVGLQRRLKELTVPDLKLIQESWIYTLLSPLVGGVLALLLYVLFLSDLISGELFPHFVSKVDNCLGYQCLFEQYGGYKDYAKLIFWCFVGGYSERFVTDVISRFEGAAVKTLPPSGNTR